MWRYHRVACESCKTLFLVASYQVLSCCNVTQTAMNRSENKKIRNVKIKNVFGKNQFGGNAN